MHLSPHPLSLKYVDADPFMATQSAMLYQLWSLSPDPGMQLPATGGRRQGTAVLPVQNPHDELGIVGQLSKDLFPDAAPPPHPP